MSWVIRGGKALIAESLYAFSRIDIIIIIKNTSKVASIAKNKRLLRQKKRYIRHRRLYSRKKSG
jgi:hypothetical protein